MKKMLMVLLTVSLFSSLETRGELTDKAWHKSKMDMEKIKLGKKTFRRKGCKGCHVIGNFKNRKLRGPDLLDVTTRRTRVWLRGWLEDPRAYIKNKDPIIMELLKKYPTKMPYLRLRPEEVEGLLEYLRSESIEVKNKHKKLRTHTSYPFGNKVGRELKT